MDARAPKQGGREHTLGSIALEPVNDGLALLGRHEGDAVRPRLAQVFLEREVARLPDDVEDGQVDRRRVGVERHAARSARRGGGSSSRSAPSSSRLSSTTATSARWARTHVANAPTLSIARSGPRWILAALPILGTTWPFSSVRVMGVPASSACRSWMAGDDMGGEGETDWLAGWLQTRSDLRVTRAAKDGREGEGCWEGERRMAVRGQASSTRARAGRRGRLSGLATTRLRPIMISLSVEPRLDCGAIKGIMIERLRPAQAAH